ncbi:erythromycin esterase family protein [Kitasatospora sp. NA04385]|uniref:erythromycin esterase family protein n=1 Tax=Kitasatospora sp. NA04385 TaxID=2742135 RepID=UPI00158FCE8C|nr:erythromycin esterase family protein [Kitasatospora sp. NA04385]QKW23600.1 erythromycin esterase family protein [Kitasatospora sp. NA04385]
MPNTTAAATSVTTAVTDRSAHPAEGLITRHPADGPPLPDAALDAIAGRLAAGAEVVGIGESTRFSRETFEVRDQLFRRLVREHGFRALAVQDDAVAAAALDAYANGGAGSAASALAGAWKPWRTAQMAAALEWVRAFNRDHPGDPVRILGVRPAQAGPADYDAVLAHVRAAAPELLGRVAAHLAPLRTAHETAEHVQRARGVHPGRPFAEHARDALALVGALPGAVEPMRLIVEFHERSVAGRGDYAGEAEVWAGTVADFRERTGLRVVYWDGLGHTSAAAAVLGLAPERGARATVGSVLRERYGARYVSAAVGFHHGDLGVVTVPAPGADLVDARLGAGAPAARWLDLRAPDVRHRWDGPAKARVISGVYTPERDAVEHLAVASLAAAFDVLVHLRRATAVHWLP